MSNTPKGLEKKGLTRTFLKYSLSSICAMWVFSIYTMVDGIFIGKGVGPTALAAVNLSMPFINTIFAIALAIAVGSSTLISFHLGRKEPERGNEIFTINIIVLTILSLSITILSLIFLDPLAHFLGATSETIDYVKGYLRIIIIFSTFFIVGYSLEVLVKADGFPAYSILFVSIGGLANIVLDYVFVILLDRGVEGAALATGISQLVACSGFLFHFLFGKRARLKFTKVKPDMATVKKMFITGFPDSITELSAGITVFLFNYVILKNMGPDGVAAFGVIMYINNLALMTMVGINQGMQPLVSYYNGRGDLDRVNKILGLALRSTLVFGLLFLTVCNLFTEGLVSMFIDPANERVFNISKDGLKVFSLSFLICGLNVIISGYFAALKLSKKAMLISLLRGLIFISLSIFLMPHLLGQLGIWLSPTVNEAATLGFSLWLLNDLKQETGYKERIKLKEKSTYA